MKKLLFVVTLLLTVSAAAQDKKNDRAAAATPGSVHYQLSKRAGEYVTVTKAHMRPNAPATETAGTAKIISILDGRFLLEENSGGQFGKPFKGVRVYGYNNESQQYEASWTYTGSTAILTMTGTSSDNGKTVSLGGGWAGAEGAMNPVNVRIRYLDDDRFIIELLGKADNGSEFIVVETNYTRKKTGGTQ